MDIRSSRRARARALAYLIALAAPTAGHAATLAAFDFDGGGSTFTTDPATLDASVVSATLGDDAGRLGDLAGNPGRALSLSGFTGGNLLHLTLTAQPGFRFLLEHLAFDLRASASGPTGWELRHAGTTLASGGVTTAFKAQDVALTLLTDTATLVLDFAGLGASAATGTLRIDNLRVDGSLVPAPVPLPGSLFLFATPLLGLGLRELRERVAARYAAPANGHSRQPSTSGKYSPSMIGRGSSAAMMRA